MAARSILIAGSTGKQGGSVIAALLAAKADYQILALTRDASSPSATKLAAKSPNIKLVEGNMDDADAIFKNARKATSSPIWGVFSVQVGPSTNSGPCSPSDEESRHLV